MKRRNYSITSTAGQSQQRHAWNAARHQVSAFARELANKDGCTYQQTGAEYQKDAAGDHCFGTLVWQGANGRTVTFTIERTA